jgi:hypothetical protein
VKIFAILRGGAHDGLEMMVDSVSDFSIVRFGHPSAYNWYYNTWTVDDDYRMIFEYRKGEQPSEP